MLVPQLLLETLEELGNADFETFKWYLTLKVLDSCKPIPKSRLEDSPRTDAVRRMMESYGEEMAVNVAVEILKMMGNNNAAECLKSSYAGRKTATPSTTTSAAAPPAAAPPAADAKLWAQQGGVIIAPTLAGGTSGTWNITINK